MKIDVMDVIELITQCVFWIFVTVWFSFFVEDLVPKTFGMVCVCIAFVSAIAGKSWFFRKYAYMKLMKEEKK